MFILWFRALNYRYYYQFALVQCIILLLFCAYLSVLQQHALSVDLSQVLAHARPVYALFVRLFCLRSEQQVSSIVPFNIAICCYSIRSFDQVEQKSTINDQHPPCRRNLLRYFTIAYDRDVSCFSTYFFDPMFMNLRLFSI